MSTQIPAGPGSLIEYPDSDGQPMSDNTLQFQWIVTIQGNLDGMYRTDPNVFVAGDLLWYPVEGQPTIRAAPDALVAIGRPKGYRGTYMQWVEGGIAPQVVFEILSPNNTREEMARKLAFYDRHGAEEYYLYAPEGVEEFHLFEPEELRLCGWRRVGDRLQPIPRMHNWISPRLGIRFDMAGPELVIYRPDGERFLTFVELMAEQEQAHRLAEDEQRARVQAQQRAEQEKQRTEQEKQRTEQEKQRAEQEKQRAEQERLAREEAERLASQARQRAAEERRGREQAEQAAQQDRQRAEQERLAREQAEQVSEQERRTREEAQRRADRLAARLRALGLDPEE